MEQNEKSQAESISPFEKIAKEITVTQNEVCDCDCDCDDGNIDDY